MSEKTLSLPTDEMEFLRLGFLDYVEWLKQTEGVFQPGLPADIDMKVIIDRNVVIYRKLCDVMEIKPDHCQYI